MKDKITSNALRMAQEMAANKSDKPKSVGPALEEMKLMSVEALLEMLPVGIGICEYDEVYFAVSKMHAGYVCYAYNTMDGEICYNSGEDPLEFTSSNPSHAIAKMIVFAQIHGTVK